DPDWTPNTTDAQGRRYRFGWQPRIAQWNLVRLAQALSPLFDDAAPLQAGIDLFATTYAQCERDDAARKLGFAECSDSDLALMHDLQGLMHDAEMDMTLFFRALSDADPGALSTTMFEAAFYDHGKRDAHRERLD